MSKEQRQKILLGALVAIMLFVAWRQFGPRLAGGLGATGSSLRGPQVASGSGALSMGDYEVVELRLDDLEKVSSQFRPGRDPFSFGSVNAVRTVQPEEQARDAEQEAEALEALRRAMEAQRQQDASSPVSSSAPVLPRLDVKFLGSFGSRQRQLAVFSDGVEIFNVLEGGVLKEHFVIRQIGFESVDVGYLQFPDEPAVRLAAGG